MPVFILQAIAQPSIDCCDRRSLRACFAPGQAALAILLLFLLPVPGTAGSATESASADTSPVAPDGAQHGRESATDPAQTDETEPATPESGENEDKESGFFGRTPGMIGKTIDLLHTGISAGVEHSARKVDSFFADHPDFSGGGLFLG